MSENTPHLIAASWLFHAVTVISLVSWTFCWTSSFDCMVTRTWLDILVNFVNY